MVDLGDLTIVAVVWHDAHAVTDSWTTLADLDPEPCVVLSVGILAPEAKPGHVVLIQGAHSLADGLESAAVDSILCIPVEMVRVMTVLSRRDQALL